MIRSSMLLALALAAPVAAQTQAQMNADAGARLRRADAALNVRYRDAMAQARATPGEAQALLAAQRAWLAFRDAECVRRSFGSLGGSMHGMDEAGCRETLTRQRIGQLRPEQR